MSIRAQDALDNNVDSLDRGLVGLSRELGGERHKIMIAVVLEFGRTFRENGNKDAYCVRNSTYTKLQLA